MGFANGIGADGGGVIDWRAFEVSLSEGGSLIWPKISLLLGPSHESLGAVTFSSWLRLRLPRLYVSMMSMPLGSKSTSA